VPSAVAMSTAGAAPCSSLRDAQGRLGAPVYLSEVDWYDFLNLERVPDGLELKRAVDLGTLPLSVRAGTVLPPEPAPSAYGAADRSASDYKDLFMRNETMVLFRCSKREREAIPHGTRAQRR
jgi:hypothetical protein